MLCIEYLTKCCVKILKNLKTNFECFQEVRKLEGRLEKVTGVVEWVNQEEALFKFPISSFPDLKELKVCMIF